MNAIERLQGDLRKRFPDIDTELDRPADTDHGTWHLDILRKGAALLVVEWRCDRGFGVSSAEDNDSDLGSGPDEIYPNGRAAFERVVQLVLSGGQTEAPSAVRLAELRQSLHLSQAELADLAGVRQANISRIEGRDDILVGTLARIVAAMGARLSIRACFPDGNERELEFNSMTAPAPDHSTSAK